MTLPLPGVQRCLKDMTAVDSHDDVHTVLSELGDISQEAPSMDTIKRVNKMALSALMERRAAFGD